MPSRIFTGAPIPSGADAVVIQEDVRREDGRILLSAAAPVPGQAARAPARAGGGIDDDEHLAAYNAYLARLNAPGNPDSQDRNSPARPV